MAGQMIATLKNRGEFLALRKCPRYKAAAFILQGCIGMDGEAAGIRVGYTVTKKTGNAVERNRIRRRLREVARQAAPGHAMPGFDYVVIARREALAQKFEAMIAQLAEGLDRTAPLGANPRQQNRGPLKGAAPSAANQRSGGT